LDYLFKASTSTEGVLAYHVNSEVPIRADMEGPKATLYAPIKPGLYRIYGMAKDRRGNIGSLNHTLKVE